MKNNLSLKCMAAVLALTLCLSFALAEDEEELTLSDLLAGVDGVEIMEDGTIVSDAAEVEAWLAAKANSIYEADGSVLITVTATGDFTIGGDTRKRNNIFENEMAKHDHDINFTMANIRDILLADDLTIVNFEGTLTNTRSVPRKKQNNEFLFSAPPEYVSVLSSNGIEAVSLENNHVMDHGEEGLADTKAALAGAGVVYSDSSEIGVYEAKGVEICMLSYLCIDRYDTLWSQVPADIAAAKAQYPIVIVNFHWGYEKDYAPRENQIKMGRLAVDSGADLVIGNHSHRMNPIEYYKGVYICYSLGNFCFAGNSKPSDMTSIVFQTRFRVRDGVVSNAGFRIIPIRISSQTARNDFIPTPLTKATSIDGVLTTLRANGRKLSYVVEEYPLVWTEE